MKWLIYLLVVVNVAFFVWQYRRGDVSTTAPAVAELASTPRLLLRREADESSLLPRGAVGQRDTPSRPDAPSRQPTPQQPGVRTGVDTSVGPRQAAATAASARTDTMPVDTKRMAQTCYAMGPFGADQSVDDLLDWLEGHGAEGTSRWSEQQTPSRYWVYLPPLDTVEQARAVLRRLKDDGLQDYVRVMRGPMRNAVSLGLFKQRDSADRRLVQLRAKGYEPKLDIRYKSERVRWLDVAFGKGLRFPEKAFGAEFPAVRWAPAHCPVAGPIAGASGSP